MEYSNPEIPEAINYSKTHPLKEFVLLTTGVIGLLVIVFSLLAFFADRLAHYIPFEMEKDIDTFAMSSVEADPQITAYLQSLADRITVVQDLPQEMQINLHYVDSDVVNAYATLGGNVIMFRGLLEKMPHENALAMVMAHEIAHVKHRHPIRSLGKGIVIGIAVSMVSSSMGDAIISDVVGNTGMVSLLKYTRDHEREADATALETLTRLYGHVYGADELFKIIMQESEQTAGFNPEFLNTHPDTEKRIERIQQLSATQAKQDFIALPAELADWIKNEK